VSRWTVHGERSLYDSDWVSLHLADVELEDGRRFEHHVVRIARAAVAAVVHDAERGVLMLHRHRFITDNWGWEVPAGRLEAGESPEDAAAREVLEETGWRPGPLTSLGASHPMQGLSDMRHNIVLARGAAHQGAPVDTHEASEVAWVPVDRLVPMMAAGEMPDGYSQHALLLALALGRLS